jgi:hypothetical protein
VARQFVLHTFVIFHKPAQSKHLPTGEDGHPGWRDKSTIFVHSLARQARKGFLSKARKYWLRYKHSANAETDFDGSSVVLPVLRFFVELRSIEGQNVEGQNVKTQNVNLKGNSSLT